MSGNFPNKKITNQNSMKINGDYSNFVDNLEVMHIANLPVFMDGFPGTLRNFAYGRAPAQ